MPHQILPVTQRVVRFAAYRHLHLVTLRRQRPDASSEIVVSVTEPSTRRSSMSGNIRAARAASMRA
jgi:hypothetical protein